MASSPLNPQTILGASAAAMLYRSTDGGDLWAPVGSGLPSFANERSIVAAASDPAMFYASIFTTPPAGGAAVYHGVYKSIDAGLTWAPANAGFESSAAYALAVDPTNANVVYTSTDSNVLKSTNGGATWNPLPWIVTSSNGTAGLITVDPKHTNILYAVGNGVFRSVDGGTSWQKMTTQGPIQVTGAYALIVDPNRTESILIGTGSGALQLTIAPDLALTVAAAAGPVAVGQRPPMPITCPTRGPTMRRACMSPCNCPRARRTRLWRRTAAPAASRLRLRHAVSVFFVPGPAMPLPSARSGKSRVRSRSLRRSRVISRMPIPRTTRCRRRPRWRISLTCR